MALPASQGLVWFREALRALKNQPVALSGIVVFNLLMMGILSSLPIVGLVLASLWMPFGVVLTAEGARDALDGRIPRYTPLKEAWANRTGRLGLFTVGIVSAVAMEIISAVFALLGRDPIAAWVIDEQGISIESVLANFPTTAALVALLLNVLLWMATTFPPLLIHRAGQAPMQSIFYSFFGILKNWASVLAFVLVLGLLTAALSAVSVMISIAMGIPSAWGYFTPFIVVFLTSIAQAGVWSMYRDIFQGSR